MTASSTRSPWSPALDLAGESVAASTAPAAPPADLLPVFSSPRMQVLLREVAAFADCEQPVLVKGDTGVGKEYIARMLHQGHGRRRGGPFVPVNCGAVPEGLFESLFYGHARGAFTGAVQMHRGLFEQASGGTLFLDEIGELPLVQQVKLLRTLEDGQVTRVGSETPIAVDVRLVTATHRDLRTLMRQGLFRADLFYRIAVVEVMVPNLAERGTADRLAVFRGMLGDLPGEPPLWLLDQVAQARLPGNLRQLRNLAERVRVVVQQTGEWDSSLLPGLVERMLAPDDAVPSTAVPSREEARGRAAEDEREQVLAALQASGWRREAAARRLGISRKTLWQRMRRHGI